MERRRASQGVRVLKSLGMFRGALRTTEPVLSFT